MYDPGTHRVHQSCDVVWLHRMFYEKCNNNSELNTNNISVGNWNNNGNGYLQFVEVGEGVIEDQTTIVQEEENNPVQIIYEEEENTQVEGINDTGVQHEENNNNGATVTTSGCISQQTA